MGDNMQLRRTPSLVSIVGTASFLLFAGAAWSACDAAEAAQAAKNRFVVQGDTVYDRETNLTWKRCTEGQRWDDVGGCVGEAELQVVEFDRKDPALSWRLPSLRELRSILAENCRNPAIDQGVFPNTVSGWYWTSTPPASRRWLLNFADGDVSYGSMRAAVRLVRSGR
jgi:hypothetical protein